MGSSGQAHCYRRNIMVPRLWLYFKGFESLNQYGITTYPWHREIVGIKIGNAIITMACSYVGAANGNGLLSYGTGISRSTTMAFSCGFKGPGPKFLVISYGGECNGTWLGRIEGLWRQCFSFVYINSC